MPAGARFLADYGFGYTGKATETISGGQLVTCVSGTNVLTTTNFPGDVVEIALLNDTNAQLATGIAIETGVSGTRIGVQTTGIYGFYAGAAIGAGSPVIPAATVASADAVIHPNIGDTSGFEMKIGRALTSAASGQSCVVLLTL